jgi:hypothetical protein
MRTLGRVLSLRSAGKLVALLGVVATACGNGDSASADAGPPAYFEGKTITIKVGFSAGGGYDLYARLHADFLGQFIPGQPTVTVENVTGMGSLLLANTLFNDEPRDGTVIGSFNSQLILNKAVCDDPELEFESDQFGWIGAPNAGLNACGVMNHAATTWPTYQAATDISTGSTGTGSTTNDMPLVLNALAGTSLTIDAGYSGTSQIHDALAVKQVDGVCFGWESMRNLLADLITGVTDPNTAEFLQFIPIFYDGTAESRDADPRLAAAMLPAEVLAEDDLATYDVWESPGVFDRPLAVPPGTDAEALSILRTAFEEMVNDPGYLAEAEVREIDIQRPKNAAETISLVEGVSGVSESSKAALSPILCP